MKHNFKTTEKYILVSFISVEVGNQDSMFHIVYLRRLPFSVFEEAPFFGEVVTEVGPVFLSIES